MMRLMVALAALGALAGCEKAKQDMYDQPRYKAYAPSPLFEDGASVRPPVPGTEPRARGAFADSTGGRKGADLVDTDVTSERAQANPFPVDLALLQRGQDRYTIYCMPCHSPAGDGDGMIVRRGFPALQTFHQDRLRTVPDRYIYDVITKGYGVMVPYADRLEPADRWAVVAFIRALQLSQHVEAASLPADERARLDAAPAVASGYAGQPRRLSGQPPAEPRAPVPQAQELNLEGRQP